MRENLLANHIIPGPHLLTFSPSPSLFYALTYLAVRLGWIGIRIGGRGCLKSPTLPPPHRDSSAKPQGPRRKRIKERDEGFSNLHGPLVLWGFRVSAPISKDTGTLNPSIKRNVSISTPNHPPLATPVRLLPVFPDAFPLGWCVTRRTRSSEMIRLYFPRSMISPKECRNNFNARFARGGSPVCDW